MVTRDKRKHLREILQASKEIFENQNPSFDQSKNRTYLIQKIRKTLLSKVNTQ